MKTLNRSDASFAIGVTRLRQSASHSFGGYAALEVIESDPFAVHGEHDRSVLFTSGVFIGR